MIAKPLSSKDAERRFGGGARKAVEITSGGMLGVTASGLRPAPRQRKIVRRKPSGAYNVGHYGPKKENPSLAENLARTVHVGGA